MNIKEIKNDQFLKNMKTSELKELSKDIRSFLLDNVSKTGGHLSSNLGDVELIISLHKNFDFENDKILFDVGHQAYVHKILTGRADKFDTLRQIDGLSGFLSNEESKYDVFESGHSSTSISTAMGMALARDNNKENYEIISFIGDASIANGVAFEALNNIQPQNNKVIIVLNDNNMSINKSVGAIAKSLSKVRQSNGYAKFKKWFLKTFQSSPKFIDLITRFVHKLVLLFSADNMFDSFNVAYIGPVDGYDFKAMDKAFKKAKSYPKSVLVHVKTKKGQGYKFAEEDVNGKYHGVTPFDVNTGQFINKEDNETFTSIIAKTMHELLENNENVYLISSAMVYCTSLDKCFNDFNNRCIDVGIAEEHSISLANGLALNDKQPYVSLYSTFMQRGYDEIVHDVCRINSNVTFLVDRAGIVGEDGKTHQGVFDVSFLYPLENSVITMPSSGKYIKPLMDCLNQYKGSKFIRYQKLNTLNEVYEENIEFGKFIYEIYNKMNKITIIAVGASCEVLKNLILKNELRINLINPIFIKPLDKTCLLQLINTDIYVYDNTSVFEGFASAVLAFYNSYNKNIHYFTLPNEYIKHGKYNDVLKYLNLDEESVLNTIMKYYE